MPLPCQNVRPGVLILQLLDQAGALLPGPPTSHRVDAVQLQRDGSPEETDPVSVKREILD